MSLNDSRRNQRGHFKGIVFAYDEAQNLADHRDKDQFPLSLLLDTFQSIQRMGMPFMLALAGLPTLFPRLVAARTFSARMFRVMFLDRLDDDSAREAIKKPLANDPGVALSDQAIEQIVKLSGGLEKPIPWHTSPGFILVGLIKNGADKKARTNMAC